MFPVWCLCVPYLCYADAVWSTCTKAQSSSLECLQNYAAYIILGRRRDASGMDMRKELGWPTLASRRTVNEAMAMSLSLSGHGPSYLTDLFKPVATSHMHMTRPASSGGIRLPQVKTEMGKKSFAHRGARRWNSFPPGARTGGAAAIHSFPLTYVCN